MGLLHGQIGIPIVVTNAESVTYLLVSGTGQLSIEGTDFDFAPGSAFFIRGAVEHQFHAITSTLDAVVVFTRQPPVASDPEAVAFSIEDMVAARSSERNVFTPLLDTSAMVPGMYMLTDR